LLTFDAIRECGKARFWPIGKGVSIAVELANNRIQAVSGAKKETI
jgi:hypothetical protein